MRRVQEEYPKGSSIEELAAELGRTRDSVRLKARELGLVHGSHRERPAKGFTVLTEIPTPNRSLDEIFSQQAERFARKTERYNVKRSGIEIKLAHDDPYGILFFGDPHADDDGCDLEKLAYDMSVVNDNENVYGACIGDLTNNWLKVLGHLYAHQGTTDDEARELLRWIISACDWLFIIEGNHDRWSHVCQTICEERGVTSVSHGAVFKVHSGDRSLTIDARHTHPGHSMYNASHAQLKRNYRGSDADIIIGGHTHQSAYTMVKNGVTGKVGHSIRVGAYKKADEYADMLGLDDACISPSVLAVIDPRASDAGYVCIFHDVDQGVKYLSALRGTI